MTSTSSVRGRIAAQGAANRRTALDQARRLDYGPMTVLTADASTDASRPWYLATTPLETRPWLIKMRWVTVAIEVVLLLLVWLAPQLDLPLDHIVWLIAADAIAGAGIAWSLSRGA